MLFASLNYFSAYGPIDALAGTATLLTVAVDVIRTLTCISQWISVKSHAPIHFHLKHAKAVKKRIYH